MHTDEYAISLSRELTVCRNTLRSIGLSLAAMEKKHGMTTEAFLEARSRGGLSIPEKDAAAWLYQHEELVRWKDREREYEELYRMMNN